MSRGGGFCERHGPYDPPHQRCPYCLLEDEQRRQYGPPGQTIKGAQSTLPAHPVEPDDPQFTELLPRDLLVPEELEGSLPPLAWLIVRRPLKARGTVLAVEPGQVIGRESDLKWDDAGLSRQHARFTLEPPEDALDAPPIYYLWPFAPTNPVFINGNEIRGATPLHENDEIRLGDTLFVFKMLTD